MPLSGSTYVAPTWRNGGPPALDAAELQAISDSIVRNQGKNADQDTLIAALQTAVSSLQSGRAKIEVGSYVGTGTYGAGNPCSLTCSFQPKALFLSCGSEYSNADYFSGFWIYPNSVFYNGSNPNSGYEYYRVLVRLNGNNIKWYNQRSDAYQFNYKGLSYYWIAFG